MNRIPRSNHFFFVIKSAPLVSQSNITTVAPFLFEPWGTLAFPSGCTGAARKELSTHHSSRYKPGTTRHSAFYSSNKILFSCGVLLVVWVAKVQIMRLIFILLFF